MTSIFEELPTPEEFEESLKNIPSVSFTWENIRDTLNEVISGVNDALNNGKATHPELIEWLTFLVTGANRIAYDLIQEGSRMKPRQNFQPALIIAQEKALFEMNVLDWRA